MFSRSFLWRSIGTFGNSRVNYSGKPKELVFFIDNMAICWHPEPKFPYECSKPLPEIEKPPESVLKISEEESYKVWSPQKKVQVIAEEMARKTHTTKHIWFPRARDKRAKKTQPDRPYL
ncbi:39S ribosomal protein L42, mitochondrial [Fopius arisanus]|uniref:Large ribosomal subunit protein mL42 n=1 Tax=Fopius arisanus TaxID=64838 RepID=A0A0C9RQC3_9HYME|nr:PREDICTED: 39S ribosomal protein L42, mitochondrial [Fopius arisanus]